MITENPISSLVQAIAELHRVLDGRVYDPVTGTYLPATPTSLTSATTAIDSSVKAMLDLLPFPVSLGAMGNISRAQADAAAVKVQQAMKVYVTATTKAV